MVHPTFSGWFTQPVQLFRRACCALNHGTDRNTCMGLYHPSALFGKVDPALSCCPSHWGSRGITEEKLKMPLQALQWMLCVRNPWSQASRSGILPHTGPKGQHWPSQRKFPHKFPNPANPERQGGKGSKMETWKEVPLPSLKGQNLKVRSFF